MVDCGFRGFLWLANEPPGILLPLHQECWHQGRMPSHDSLCGPGAELRSPGLWLTEPSPQPHFGFESLGICSQQQRDSFASCCRAGRGGIGSQTTVGRLTFLASSGYVGPFLVPSGTCVHLPLSETWGSLTFYTGHLEQSRTRRISDVNLCPQYKAGSLKLTHAHTS